MTKRKARPAAPRARAVVGAPRESTGRESKSREPASRAAARPATPQDPPATGRARREVAAEPAARDAVLPGSAAREPGSRKGSPRSASGVTIRSLSIDDLAAVYHLGAELFRAGTFPALYRTWDEFEVVAFFESDYDTCFVAVDDDDEVVGFVLGTVLEKRRSAWRYGWVVWIGVDQAQVGTGVAGKLLERVTEAFVEIGCRILLADTDPENRAAVRFFEKAGFGNPRRHVYLEKNLGRSKK